MSQENVELIRKLAEAFNRHDLQGLEALSHKDLEFVSVLATVDASWATFRGREAWTSYFAAMDEMWEGWQVKDVRVVDAGDDRLASSFRVVGTGKATGARVGEEIGMAYRIRDGKLWRMRSYLDPADALEAVGLSG